MNSVELIKKICKERKIPLSKLERDLGYGNAYISQLRKGIIPSDRAMEIAKYLNIDLLYLLSGGETTNNEVNLTQRDERDIAKRLDNTLSDLENSQSALMFYGEPLDDETRELLKASLENSIRIAKINAKQKFTPKKYRTSGE